MENEKQSANDHSFFDNPKNVKRFLYGLYECTLDTVAMNMKEILEKSAGVRV